MATLGKKISALDPSPGLDGTEQVEIVDAGVSVRTTTQDIADLAPSATIDPTSLISSVSNMRPEPGVLFFGVTAQGQTVEFGGHAGVANWLSGYDFAAGNGATRLARHGRRKSTYFTNGAGGTGGSGSPYYNNPGIDLWRRPSVGASQYAGLGLTAFMRFGFNHGAFNWPRFFVGFGPNSPQVISTVDGTFAAMVNVMGVGKDDLDANIQFLTNDNAGSIVKVNSGIPYQGCLNHMLGFALFSAWDSDLVHIEFIDYDSGLTATHDFTTELPVADTTLTYTYRHSEGFHNGGAGLQIDQYAIDFFGRLPH